MYFDDFCQNILFQTWKVLENTSEGYVKIKENRCERLLLILMLTRRY